MIINSAPQNEAILSNVDSISTFNIKSTAKSFAILSSGLYANKIRAIIRELSCNAYDSHVAANKIEAPFDLHLPTKFEPWFSIRDYGTGLTHEQVLNVYTTYFESTKTGSNDFIGALGLGSKSPFSYTDNFTVTAIKDGVKGMYSAFINEQGIPSIALLMTESTDKDNGVEVKFSVDSYEDFYSFNNETVNVFKHFKTKPTLTGGKVYFYETSYKEKDIVPGIHSTVNGGNSVAVMGNIEYPINIPKSNTVLGDLVNLLECSLEIHFNIGELDFQASREGLSYIPLTINSIKSKLEQLNNNLSSIIEKEISDIPNMWKKCEYLIEKHYSKLWGSSVVNYISSSGFDMLSMSYNQYVAKDIAINVEEINEKYNISIRAYKKTSSKNSVSPVNPFIKHLNVDNKPTQIKTWNFAVSPETFFITNDNGLKSVVHNSKTQLSENKKHSYNLYILDSVDKTKDMDLEGFFEHLKNPPENQIIAASSINIVKKTRVVGQTFKGMIKVYDSYSKWTNNTHFDKMDQTKTYYYIPLSNKTPIISKNIDFVLLYKFFKHSATFKGLNIYGVNKTEIRHLKGVTNWVNVEDAIASELSTITDDQLLDLIYPVIQIPQVFTNVSTSIKKSIKSDKSEFKTAFSFFEKYKDLNLSTDLSSVIMEYSQVAYDRYKAIKAPISKSFIDIKNKYSMLNLIGYGYHSDENRNIIISDYINLVDSAT